MTPPILQLARIADIIAHMGHITLLLKPVRPDPRRALCKMRRKLAIPCWIVYTTQCQVHPNLWAVVYCSPQVGQSLHADKFAWAESVCNCEGFFFEYLLLSLFVRFQACRSTRMYLAENIFAVLTFRLLQVQALYLYSLSSNDCASIHLVG